MTRSNISMLAEAAATVSQYLFIGEQGVTPVWRLDVVASSLAFVEL
jgi:hypothetical protein